MAKRRAAEPLTFRVPWKRLLLGDFPEEPPLWVPPSGATRPGKRRVDAGTMAEPAAAPRKRRGGGDVAPGGLERSHGPEPGEPEPGEPEPGEPEPGEPPPRANEQPRDGSAPGGGGDGGAGSTGGAGGAPSQHNEEFWQYNTFQYWRNPLLPIDLADIEDVSPASLTETTPDKNEGVEIEMES